MVAALDAPPLIHSISYGDDEAQQISAAFMAACNTEFQKLGVRGISVLIASGDNGVCGREGCHPAFQPDWPAT